MQVERTTFCRNCSIRRVWNFLTGMCGECDPETLRRREVGAARRLGGSG